MDYEMPIKNGLEATEYLVAKMKVFEIYPVPIIACTTYQDEEHKTACVASGMAGYLNKPVYMSELKSILRDFQVLEEDVI